MKAAIVEAFGHPPICAEVPEPDTLPGYDVVSVRAAAIKNIERMLVAGTHYASGKLSLPAQIGMDAVVESQDGTRAYAGATPPGGTMAERMIENPAFTVPIPAAVDDATASALPNAGVSAWLALEYTGQLHTGQSVLVLGATGITGGLAVQLAKHTFSAGHVVAVGRDNTRLNQLRELGADETIELSADFNAFEKAISDTHQAHPFDLVLDFLWGKPAEHTLRALGGDNLGGSFHRTRFVQIGESAGANVTLPASVLRSAGVELLGQGGGSVPHEAFERVMTNIIPTLFDQAAHGLITINTVRRRLEDVRSAWAEQLPSGTRAVLVPSRSVR